MPSLSRSTSPRLPALTTSSVLGRSPHSPSTVFPLLLEWVNYPPPPISTTGVHFGPLTVTGHEATTPLAPPTLTTPQFEHHALPRCQRIVAVAPFGTSQPQTHRDPKVALFILPEVSEGFTSRRLPYSTRLPGRFRLCCGLGPQSRRNLLESMGRATACLRLTI